jgi:hypothetical protein
MKSVWPCPLLNSFVPAFRAFPARRTEVVSCSNYPMSSRNGIHSTIAFRDRRHWEPPLPPDMPGSGSQGWTYCCYVYPWLGTRDMLNGGVGYWVALEMLPISICYSPKALTAPAPAKPDD